MAASAFTNAAFAIPGSLALLAITRTGGDPRYAFLGVGAVMISIAAIMYYRRNKLPEGLYDTAYSLAVEVAAADLHVEQEELRLLQILRDRLGLDKLTCAAIERGAMARYRTH